MRNYLATTGISEIWDLESNLLFLGPWCLTDEKNKRLLEGKDYRLVSSPWKPAFKIKEAADYCHKLYEELLPQVSESLNSIHKLSYPLAYWRVLLGPWLLCFIEILYDRYKRIEMSLELFPDFYTNVLPNEQCKIPSYDMFDFFYKAHEDYYNLKLFSLILHDLCPRNIHNVIIEDFNLEYKVPQRMRYSWKRKLFNKFIKSFDAFFKNSIVLCDIFHITPQEMILFKSKGGFETFRFMHFELREEIFPGSYCREIRDAIKLKGAINKFQPLLYKMLPKAIPISYVENYKFYKSRIENIRNIDSVKIVGSSVAWFSNEKIKIFSSETQAKGASLIEFQHGGGYGVLLNNSTEKLSMEKDIFYTWGWNSKKDKRIKSLPSPHLSKLENTYSPKSDNILFVGTFVNKYHYRFHTVCLPEDVSKYFEDKKIFFQALPEEIRNKILYRPWVYAYGWGEKLIDMVKRECPNVRFVLAGNITKWMQNVKLVVIDHSSTTFIEALTINCPCIFYWDHEVNLMRPGAERYFNLLRDAEILFKDPSSAAKKVETVYSDPMSWWLQDNVQNARMEFCKQYAYARGDWMEIWTKELKQLLRERKNK